MCSGKTCYPIPASIKFRDHGKGNPETQAPKFEEPMEAFSSAETETATEVKWVELKMQSLNRKRHPETGHFIGQIDQHQTPPTRQVSWSGL